jgi:hypothetical protein
VDRAAEATQLLNTLDTIVQRYRLARTTSAPKVLEGGRTELCHLFAMLGFTNGAEIGVWKGEFAAKLCQRIPNLRLLCVDPWAFYE